MPVPPIAPALGYARILKVAEAVAAIAPARLEDVMLHTGLPRSATYRCLKELEAQGWIRKLMSGQGFVLTHAIQGQLAQGAGRRAVADALADRLGTHARLARIDADIAVMRGPADLHILETTRATPPADQAEPFLGSGLALAALLVTPKEARLTHVRAAMATAQAQDQALVTSGHFTHQLSEMARIGHVWDPITQSLCFPFLDNSGSSGAIRLEGSGSNSRTADKLRSVMNILNQELPALVPDVDQIQRRFWPALVNRQLRNNPQV